MNVFWENEVFLEIAVLKVARWNSQSKSLHAFQNTYFPEHVSVDAFKSVQGILLIILKLLKSSTKFRLLEPGDEVWCKEFFSVDIWHVSFLKND